MGFSKGWQGCSEEFPEGEAQGKSQGAALPARGKPHPSLLFYQIYIVFLIGIRIGPPKMHSWFRIGLPKMHIRCHIGPPGSVLALLHLYLPS